MRTIFLGAPFLAISLAVSMSNVSAQEDDVECRFKNGVVVRGAAACQKEINKIAAQKKKLAEKVVAIDAPIPPISPPSVEETSWQPPEDEGPRLFLRRNMEDLGSLSAPTKLKDAAGAQVAWTNDHVLDNRSWAVQGILAYRFNTYGAPALTTYIPEQSFGVYLEFDRLSNSRLITKNHDILTFGARYEAVVANFANASHVLVFDGQYISNFEGDSKSWNVKAEYFPVGPVGPNETRLTIFNYFNRSMEFPLAPTHLHYFISPKLRAEYRGELEDANDPLFAARDRAFRVGASIGLTVYGNPYLAYSPSFKKNPTGQLLTRSNFKISYGFWHDVTSDLEYKYLEAAYTYHLDDSKNWGISFSYRKGELDQTGERIDIAKIALSGKFDFDPRPKPE